MNYATYLKQSLFYFWRTNLAVLLGVVAATAVIGGALVVGDSVRYSLKQMTLERLGNIDSSLTAGRFFTEDLVTNIEATAQENHANIKFAPAMSLVGALVSGDGIIDEDEITSIGRVSSVQLYGIDDRFAQCAGVQDFQPIGSDEIVLNARCANALGVKVGDQVTVYLDIPSAVPRDTLLGERDETTLEMTFTVSQIPKDESFWGRYSLLPNQQLPFNAFLNLAELQDQLDLAAVPRSRRNPRAKPARVNTIVASHQGEHAGSLNDDLQQLLRSQLSLTDLNLALVEYDFTTADGSQTEYIALESDRMILERSLGETARKAAMEANLATLPVLVYLVNDISNPDNADNYASYSVAAGLDLASEPPFGPFTRVSGEPATPLQGNNVAVNQWLAKDLGLTEADLPHEVEIKYHVVGSRGELPEEERSFSITQILKFPESRAADPGLTPLVEGITTADSFDEWEQPFPMDLGRVTDRDDLYWEDFRATPKMFFSLEAAQDLWQSRYGDLTSIHIADPKSDMSIEELKTRFETEFLKQLDPKPLGLVFQPVKQQGLQAAQGTTDFSGLFLGFSIFLIFAALVLIALLFRLGVEQRVRGIGLLAAIGLTKSQVQRVFLLESTVIVVIGSLLGGGMAIAYAWLMIYGLTTWWIGAVGTQFLELHIVPSSLLIAIAITIALALGVVWWALRMLNRISIRNLLYGVTEIPTETSNQQSGQGRLRLAAILAGLTLFLMLASLIGMIPSSELFFGFSWKAGAFFTSGMLSLIAGYAFFSYLMKQGTPITFRMPYIVSTASLALSNTSRHQQRSLATIGLISSATFLVVAVASGRFQPAQVEPDLSSGNGGFTLLAESSRPILYDWQTKEGRDQLNLLPNDDKAADKAKAILDQSKTYSFLFKPGQESSCLNLYQTQQPTILGVSPDFIERGGFAFANTPGDNPWTLLNEEPDDGTIPALGDMNTLLYSLHKSSGQTLELDESAIPDAELKIAGMLSGSVFQGVLLISERNFRRLFPDVAGYRYFLIETPLGNATPLTRLLETRLLSYGLDATRVSDRIQSFLAVQNTYLSTFQSLGGLGLLLGTLGLSIVMVRNVLERRKEVALLRAVGLGQLSVTWLIVVENAVLLLAGLLLGTICALISMAPHLMSTGASVPFGSIFTLLGWIFVIGMLGALFAVAQAVRTPIVRTLKSE